MPIGKREVTEFSEALADMEEYVNQVKMSKAARQPPLVLER